MAEVSFGLCAANNQIDGTVQYAPNKAFVLFGLCYTNNQYRAMCNMLEAQPKLF